MDIEQLKMILDTLGSAGDGAFIIALLWVLQGYIAYFLGGLLLLVAYRAVIKIAALLCEVDSISQAFGFKPISTHGHYGIATELRKIGEHYRNNPDLWKN